MGACVAEQRQRDELGRLGDPNDVIREVTQALVSASTQAEIERPEYDRFATSAVADAALVGDVPSETAQTDQRTVAGVSFGDGTDCDAGEGRRARCRGGVSPSNGVVVTGRANYRVLVSSASEARTLLGRFRTEFPATDLRAKRERDHPLEDGDSSSADHVAGLRDRQRECLESAYRAGYFEWPGHADVEEVAESMDITSPTIQAHVRKAQRTLFEDPIERNEGT